MGSWGVSGSSIAARGAVVLAAVLLAACSARSLVPARAPAPAAPRAGTSGGVPAISGSAGGPAATAPAGAAPAAAAAATTTGVAVAVESPAVAARFPDPAVAYDTPAFAPGRAGFTDNAELRDALHALVRSGDGSAAGSTAVRLVVAGASQGGVPIEALHFGRPAQVAVATGLRPSRPTVLLVGQQHGDEPAGAEALLVVARRLADGTLGALLDRLDVVVLPRANPDAAAGGRRLTASAVDLNRDHLLLRTPEAQAQARLMREFAPLVVVDAHEFAALGRFVGKFGAARRHDALVQYAMVANASELVSKAAEQWFRQPMLQAFRAEGLASEWYHTTSAQASDRRVSMGGVQPDNGRNVAGLRNAVSLLVETRGSDIGRAHLARRVHAQVVAITSVLQSTAARASDLQRLRRFVDADTAARACRGEMVVEAGETPSEYDLTVLDPLTGADRVVNVAWDSALALTVAKRRARPCGYWLGADQLDAALRLRTLGVQVQRLEEDGELRGEAYAETARETVERADVRGAVADAEPVPKLQVELVPALLDVRAGGYYVGLDQPLAHLVTAALEPDTPSSFAAHRVVGDVKSTARVLARPDVRMTPLP